MMIQSKMILYKVYDKHSGKTYDYDERSDEKARSYVTKVVNLRTRVYEELEGVEKSFEAAKRTMDQIEQQIRQVRGSLEATPARTGKIFMDDEEAPAQTGCSIIDDCEEAPRSTIIDWDEEAELDRFKKEVRTLKYKIPYSLIYPPPVDHQINHPNVVWHPRITTTSTVPNHHHHTNREDNNYRLVRTSRWDNMDLELAFSNPNFYFLHHPDAPPRGPSSEELAQSLINLRDDACRHVLECLRCFPAYYIIKRTVLFNCFRAHTYPADSSSLHWKQFDDATNNLTALGFLRPICKRSTSSVSSYWMDDNPRSSLLLVYCPSSSSVHLPPSPVDEQQIFYGDNRPILRRKKVVKSLILGKWHRSSPLKQHIEVADPDLFYKGMDNLTEVKYISLRGISMIPELPQFITKLKKLQTLDCKACHDLEAIPDNINKLWKTLTHLDISECCLLDHMPTTLSDLVHLRVLKGFHVREPDHQRSSCTLRNLTKLSKLQKLHICTSMRGFPDTDQLIDLQKFPSLRNLGISWRVRQRREETTTVTTLQRVLTHKDSTGCGGDQQQFSFGLEKLDLQCVPNTVTRMWLNPVVFRGLRKLYIRGGSFFDLGQNLDGPKEENASVYTEENKWTVELLRLKHLKELKMDKTELDNLFPELISLEKVDCPNLTSFCCDNSGIWIKPTNLPPTISLLLNRDQ